MNPLTAVKPYAPTVHDLLHERKMQRVLQQHLYADNRIDRSELWAQYSKLHASRSRAYVAWMERERRLACG